MWRSLIFLSVVALAPCCFGQAAKTRPESWQELHVVDAGEITVQLRVRKHASLANEKWLAFVFHVRGNQAVEFRSVSYRFESEGFDAATGKPLYTSSLGRGNDLDLFGKGRPPRSLPAGVTEVWQHPSDYATALLSERAAPTRVDAKLYFSLTTAEGRVLRARANGNDYLPVTFVWHNCQPSDLPAIQTRLRKRLASPPTHHSAGYVVGRLLQKPEVGGAITAEELVDVLPRHMKNAFSGRQPILQHLNKHHADAPALLEFVHSQLLAANKPRPSGARYNDYTTSSDVQTLLQQLPKVWRDDFLEPLLKLYEADGSIRHSVLRHLSSHGLPKQDDQKLSRRLSAVFLTDGRLKLLDEELARSSYQLTMLGRTRDRQLIPQLVPLLRDRRPLPPTGLPMLKQRICDVAYRAILTILDGSPSKGRESDKCR